MLLCQIGYSPINKHVIANALTEAGTAYRNHSPKRFSLFQAMNAPLSADLAKDDVVSHSVVPVF
jgi:hypothetical protein